MSSVRPPRPIRRLAAAALSLVVSIALLVFGLPRLTGTTWSTTGSRIVALSLTELTVLASVWLVGLFVHTYVMVVAVPTLGHRRAMMLNFSGSAVSNVVPFGGVLGMGMNYTMLRSWGFSKGEFTSMTIITHIWTMATKLILPSLAVALLLVTGRGLGRPLMVPALTGLGLVALVVAISRTRRRGGIGSTARLPSVARLLDRIIAASTNGSVADLRRQILVVMRHRWQQLTAGAIGYALMQALLLWLCLDVFHAGLSPIDAFAGFAVGGLLTLLPITPGGLGVSETGMAALLIALGGDPAATTAAVLLFRTFTFLLEIPAGALCTAAWWMRRATANSTTVQAATIDGSCNVGGRRAVGALPIRRVALERATVKVTV